MKTVKLANKILIIQEKCALGIEGGQYYNVRYNNVTCRMQIVELDGQQNFASFSAVLPPPALDENHPTKPSELINHLPYSDPTCDFL